LQVSHLNPLNSYGKKCFSQTDEDGITLEILKRINFMGSGVYAEFGVGKGVENNTLILAAMGWKGFWCGGEDLIINMPKPYNNKRFSYIKSWLTLDNILNAISQGLKEINEQELDVISIDLDGNDIYFVEKILQNNFKPKLFIVEYNAKFIPPIKFKIEYDLNHIWKFDDYFGASLSSFDALFEKFGYKLICCNSQSGANAFFIDASYAEFFNDVPNGIEDIYVEPRYYLYNNYGHKPSAKTIERILFSEN
jgi:hypothetical protein